MTENFSPPPINSLTRRHNNKSRSSILIIFLSICSLIATLAGVGANLTPALAQDSKCAGTWNNLRWTEGLGVKDNSYKNSGYAIAEFDWQANPEAKPGDIITFTLPNQLEPATRESFELQDSQGNKVADARWSGKQLLITLSAYQGERHEVQGKVKLTLQWDLRNINRQEGFNGQLPFSGCSNDSLRGEYEPEGPTGNAHVSGKVGVYDGTTHNIQINGEKIYTTRWVIYVGSETKGTEGPNATGFTVTDKAQPGHKFICDAKLNNGRNPLEVSSRYQDRDWPGQIVNSDGQIQGGKYTGLIGDYPHRGHHFDASCSENEIKVSFPYGVSPESGPRIELMTYTTEKPREFSYQTNTAVINGTAITGNVLIPGANGEGSGKFGGFALKKVVNGETLSTPKDFKFSYQCIGTTGNKKMGVLDVSAKGGFVHVGDIEKDMRCTVEEILPNENHVLKPKLTWIVDGQPAEKAEFVSRSQQEKTFDLIATNTYAPSPNGTFTVKKVIEGKGLILTDNSINQKQFKGEYKCDPSEKWTEFSVSKEVPFISPEFPAGTVCQVREKSEGGEIEGHTWTRIQDTHEFTILSNNQPSVPVTFINRYEPKVGGFSISKNLGGSAKDAPALKHINYSFNYSCGLNKEISGELKVKAGESVKGPQNIPVGTECTIHESAVDMPSGLSWTGVIMPHNRFTIEENKDFTVQATNNFDYSHGGFSIVKTIGGNAGNITDLQDKNYEFNYVCMQPNGPEIKKTVHVTPGQSFNVEAIEAGSQCTVTESAQTNPGSKWEVEYSGEGVAVDDNSAQFTVKEENSPTVVVNAKNTFTQHVGGFSIEKTVKAENGITTPQSFNFSWTCGARSGTTTVPVSKGIGAVEVAQDIPVGTECSVTELNAEVPGTTLVKQWENQNFKISQQSETVKVAVTNSYQKTFGGFEIVKKLKGTERDKAADKKFEFSYVCSKPDDESAPSVKGILHVIGEGKTEQVTTIPTGYECTIEEKEASIVGTRWTHSIEKNGKLTITENGAFHAVRAVNTYEKPHITPPIPWLPFVPLIPFIPLIPLIPMVVNPPHPAPPSSVPPAPADPQKPQDQKPTKRQLANTGLNLGGIALAVIILSGLGLFLIRRSTRKS